MKRFLSLLLIMAMLLSALPQTVFAASVSHEHLERTDILQTGLIELQEDSAISAQLPAENETISASAEAEEPERPKKALTSNVSGSCGTGVTWSLNTSGVLTISGSGAIKNYTSSSNTRAPWYNYGADVTAIVIESGVTAIGNYAFYWCSKITAVTIPDSVTSIGTYAFYGCDNLASIAIPDSVTGINSYAFSSCDLLSDVTLGNGMKSIGSDAFSSCPALTSITIPSSVTSIGSYAFYSCKALKSVTILNPECSIYSSSLTFGSASNVTIYGMNGSTAQTYAKKYGYAFADIRSKTMAIDGVTAVFVDSDSYPWKISENDADVGSDALISANQGLSNTSSETSITFTCDKRFRLSFRYAVSSEQELDTFTVRFDDTVVADAISGSLNCYSYTSKYLTPGRHTLTLSYTKNASVDEGMDTAYLYDVSAEVYEYVDSGTCGDNVSWFLDSEGLLRIVGSGAMTHYDYYTCTPWYNLFYTSDITSVVVEDGVTTIGDYVFYGCRQMTSVTLPDSITSIGRYAFANCEALPDVIIPDSVKTIGESAFDDCDTLSDVTIPDSVKTIGRYAFFSCDALQSVMLGSGVVIIDEAAFSSCAVLTRFSVDEENAHFSADEYGVLFNKDKTELILCPDGYSGDYVIPDGVISIAEFAFSGCDLLTSVTISDSVQYINRYAFESCDLLTGITIPKGVESIAATAFDSSSKLMSFFVDEENMYFSADEKGVLFNKDKTVLVRYPEGRYGMYEVPSSVISIGNSGFYQCRELPTVVLPEGLISIGESAFAGCDTLSDVTIPDSVKTIGGFAFYNCDGLTSVTLPESVSSVGGSAFADNYLKSVIILNPACECASSSLYNEGIISRYSSSTIYGYTGTQVQAHTEKYEYNFADVRSLVMELGDVDVTFDDFEDLTWRYVENDPKFGEVVKSSNEGVHSSGSEMTATFSSESRFVLSFEYAVSSEAGDKLTILLDGVPIVDGVSGEIIAEYTSDVLRPGEHTLTFSYAKNGSGSAGSDAAYLLSLNNEIIPGCGHYELQSFAAQAPTCEESGRIDYWYCGDCETYFADAEAIQTLTYEQTQLAPTGHTPTTDEAIAPTCTETGLTEGSHCSVCDKVLLAQELVPATGHTEVIDEAVAPTCTETGLTEGKHCSVCGEVLVAQNTVDALGHTEVIDKAVAPTCTETGLTEGKHCSVCGEVLVAQNTVDALGHTEVIDKAVAPTCTETGLTEGKHCSVCGKVLLAQRVVDALGHEYTSVVTAPTCLDGGYTIFTCTVCSETWRGDETAPLGHSSVRDEAVEATCFESGLTEGSHCGRCNIVLVEQNVVPAKGHTEAIDAAVAPTCLATGLTEGKYCSECGMTLVAQEVIPATGHTIVIDEAVRATCLSTGLTEGKHCSVCGRTLVVQQVVPKKDHTVVVDEAVAPDCETAGLTEGSHCAVCGRTIVAQKVIAAMGHTIIIDEGVEATCLTTGLTEGKHCSTCSKTLIAQTVIPAKGHTVVVEEAVEADCENSGLTEGRYCSVCGEILSEQTVIPANGHTEVIDEAVEPDCENTGLTEGKHCSVCGKVLVEQQIIPANGHTEVIDEAVEPDCENTGLTEGKHCSVCGKVLVEQQIIPANGHTEVIDDAVEPDCENTGLTEGKHCSVCGKVLVEQQIIPANGHTEVIDEAVEPDCENTGLTEGKHCSVCGKVLVEQQIIPANGHTEVIDEAVEPDCENTGLTEGKHCSVCGKVLVEQQIIPANGHTEVIDEAIEPDCENTGLTEGKHCSVCGKVLVEQQIIPANGHTEVIDEAVEPDCENTGLTEGKHCSVCGKVLVEQKIIAPLGHDHEAVVTEPTCTENGYTTYTCTKCGDSYTADEVPANGHSYEAVAIDPTCDKAGSITYTCTVCGHSYINIISAIDHSYGEGVTTAPTCTQSGYTTYTCSVCGLEMKTDTVSSTGHSYEAVVTEPTCLEKGYTTYTCANCAISYRGDEVPARGHSYVDDICTVCGFDNGAWSFNAETGELIIRRQSAMDACGNTMKPKQPWEQYSEQIKTVTILDGVVSIGECAFFKCSALTSVKIPESVTSIGTSAFNKCTALTEFKIPENVTSISEGMFAQCTSLTHVDIHDNVTSIGNTAFYACTAMTTVKLGAGVRSIGNTAFRSCRALECITIANSVASIGIMAFLDCGKLDHVLYTGTQSQWDQIAISAENSALTSATRHCNAVGDEVYWIAVDGGKQLYCKLCDITCLHATTEIRNAVSVTCTENGYSGDTWCTECEILLTKGVTVSATGHSYEAVVTEPTCAEDGYTTYTCTRCGDSYTGNYQLPLDHSYVEVVTEPTCTENGYTTYTCTGCGDSYANIISATGHSYEAVVTEPTYTEVGYTTYTCTVCGDSYTDNYQLPLYHNYVEVVTEPTCTEKGYTTYTCTGCGNSYTADEVPANGHNYEAVVTEPTCTEGGHTTYTCTTCGDSYTADEAAAKGHSYNEENICTACGQRRPIIVWMYDMFGDGWADNRILVYENDVLVEELTITDSAEGTADIAYDTSSDYRFVWKTGIDAQECAIKLTLGEKTLYECSNADTLNDGEAFFVICAHSWVDATCQKPKTCEKCGLSEGALGDHSYSYSDNGEKHTVACKNCDYSAEEDHSYVDGKCICGASQSTGSCNDENLKFNMNIAIGAEMVVNYNFMASTLAKYEDFYLEVKKNVAGGEPVITTYGVGEGHIPMGVMNHPVTGEALLYNASYNGINAKEMGDTFETTLYGIDANGKVWRGETVISSIKAFLMGKLEDARSSAELKTMAVDMLRYGEAAQHHFNYDTENLVTNALTEEQLAYATQETPEAVDYQQIGGAGTNVSANIMVGSKVELSLSTIARGIANPAAVRCVIADKDGKVLAELTTACMANVMFSAKYDNVGAREMRKMISATFYDGSGNVISKTLNWSVESYVARTRASANASKTELAMVNTMLAYGDSVAAYLDANGL